MSERFVEQIDRVVIAAAERFVMSHRKTKHIQQLVAQSAVEKTPYLSGKQQEEEAQRRGTEAQQVREMILKGLRKKVDLDLPE
jgi:hypothetical protein